MKVGVPGVGAAGSEATGGASTTPGGDATVVVVVGATVVVVVVVVVVVDATVVVVVVVVVGVTCHWANKVADPSIGKVYSSPAMQGEPEPSIWVFQPANV